MSASEVGPRQLGPYRLVKPLGRGGMGEVFLAEDPRLERRVAIKRLDLGGDEDPVRLAERRARFRREARVLAKLRHPAIVQVYELLSVDGEDHLVMEHVDGPDLGELLRQEGPLPWRQVARVAHALSEALDHAHRIGVMHRDVKIENVLLDAEGQPRLADFGLARSWIEGDSLRGFTAEGRVLGTVRAMAPEQLTGDSVDARADLFALGVLMVEALTGRSPFLGSTRRETAGRVIADPPPPLAEHAPPPLVGLIEHLLEKDPELRPRSAEEVRVRLEEMIGSDTVEQSTFDFSSVRIATANHDRFAGVEMVDGETSRPSARPGFRPTSFMASLALTALIFALVAFLIPQFSAPRAPERLHIAVLAPEIEGLGPEESRLLSFAVRSAAVRSLAGFENVVVPGSAEVDAVAAGKTPRQVSRSMAVDRVLTGRISCGGAECWLELSLLQGGSGDALWTKVLQAPPTEPQTLAWGADQAVRSSLSGRRHDGKAMPLELVEAILRLRFPADYGLAQLDPSATFEQLGHLRRRFGPHLELDLWRARLAARTHATQRDSVWLERAFESLDAAAEQAPDDLRVALAQVDLMLGVGRLDETEAVLEALSGQKAGDVRLEERLARLAMARGDAPGALERMRGVVERRPSWSRLLNLASMASQAGEVALAFETLERLEQRSPDLLLGRQLRATLELKSGDLDRAAELYRRLADEAPDVSTWNNLALVHLLRREAASAIEALERARELTPSNPFVLINLADAYRLDGREEAGALYRRVEDLLSSARQPQELTTRAQARARLGDVDGALADIEVALRQNPENSSMRYEAALVFALVGDLRSAERNRRAALELGHEARWFSLPAFDALEPLDRTADSPYPRPPSPSGGGT